MSSCQQCNAIQKKNACFNTADGPSLIIKVFLILRVYNFSPPPILLNSVNPSLLQKKANAELEAEKLDLQATIRNKTKELQGKVEKLGELGELAVEIDTFQHHP